MNQAADGSVDFFHGTVMSVLFNTDVNKRGGGTYPGTILNYMDNQGQPKFQNWAQQIIDNDRNIEIRNALVQLHGAPGAPFTIHRTKKGQYWNVDRIDMGHVEGVRSSPAAAAAPALPGAPVAGAPVYPANNPAAVAAAAAAPSIREEKSRSKEQCMRGDAIQAAAVIEAVFGDVNIDRFYANAEIAMNYIVNGLAPPAAAAPVAPVAAPVVAPPAAPVAPVAPAAPAPAAQAAPAVAPAPPAPVVAPAAAVIPPPPAPTVPTAAPAPPAATVPTTPAPAPAAPAPIPAPGAPAVAAQPAAFDDGFGTPGA